MSKNTGFSVRIFIPSGEPDALRIVEKSNWTGQGLVFPRTAFKETRTRSEINRAGVYILWGLDEATQATRAYIGEGDGVLLRLEDHYRSKDFWTHAIVFSSKDLNMNKAHVQYLESRLVSLALDAKRCQLENGNNPQLPAISDADKADMESFLYDLLLCLPIMGVTFFEKPVQITSSQDLLYVKIQGLFASGYETNQGFVVLKGSTASIKETAGINPSVKAMRASLLSSGVLVSIGINYEFTQDFTFSSPSAASGSIIGRSSNGRDEWKDANGLPLKAIQAKLAAVPSPQN